MIRHVVMWRVAGDTPDARGAARQRIKQAFEGLHGRIPGLLRIEVGLDASAAAHACDAVLVSDFESQAALDAYAAHPEHLRVRAELDGLRRERYQVDYRVEPPWLVGRGAPGGGAVAGSPQQPEPRPRTDAPDGTR